ncbi:hypothetical protein [Butyrivibrio sp. AE3004]|uniref:hypothetical protein n=1 Tax=Butyrivibrio sp. AE3004 TaxID=1506994 RepID=UPI000493F7E4|nr:hypothetical protein [Butyrivibrio sp. AE3004]
MNALEVIAAEYGYSVEDIIDDYVNLEHYEESCFEDWNFLQMDNMIFDELKSSMSIRIWGW